MAYPQIVYGPDDTILSFTYPPVNKPGANELEATRHVSTSTSGVLQIVHERTDNFKTLEFSNVPLSDMPDWETFITYALIGNTFKYYPDSLDEEYTTYFLMDDKWVPKLAFKNHAKFTLRVKEVVA